MLRKLVLQLPVLAFLVLGVASQALAQTSMRAISDFSYLRNEPRSLDQRVEDFITDLRAGNRQAFKYVTYPTAEAAIVRLREEAEEYPAARTWLAEVDNDRIRADLVIRYLVATTASDEAQARATLVRATLPGIFNMDPKIRLVAADLLRGLRPDASMARAVKLAVGVDVEVIRWDARRGEFVFRAPRILETVASANEIYREKDLDWPTSFDPGLDGPNNDPEVLYLESPQLRDGGNENTTTGLTARRWGDFEPVYDPELGYQALTADQRARIMDNWYGENVTDECARAIRELEEQREDGGAFPYLHRGEPGAEEIMALAECRTIRRALDIAQARYGAMGGEITAPDFDRYRHYPDRIDVEGDDLECTDRNPPIREGRLLMDQYRMQGEMVPLGQGAKYIYMNRHLQIRLGNPWAELTKLDEYITREMWWNKILAGESSVMTYLSKDTFGTLFRSIDGEVQEAIPFLSFATCFPRMEHDNPQATDRMVDVLIVGLQQNPVLQNKYVILRALKDIYVDPFGKLDTLPQTREKINVALWQFRRMANRLGYSAGRILMAEAITVGKRPANEWEPIRPVSDTVLDVDDELELGFRIPNSEVRASSYRLITMGEDTTASDDREAMVDLKDRFNAIFYAYRRPDSTLMTWYNDRAEWRRRAEGITNLEEQAKFEDSDWIPNYEQMTNAQRLINAILSGDQEVMRRAVWPDVEAAVILTLYRTYLRDMANSGETPKATTFMDQLQRVDIDDLFTGDAESTEVDADDDDLRDRLFRDAGIRGGEDNDTFSEEKREAIKQAAIGGLFNRDPRIRLTAIHFLRRLGPDETMLDAVLRARSIVAGSDPENLDPETNDYLNSFIDTNVYERIRNITFANGAGNLGDYERVPVNRYRGVLPEEVISDTPFDGSGEWYYMYRINPAYQIQTHEYQPGLYSNLAGHRTGTGAGGESLPVRGTDIVRYYGLYQIKSPGEELNKLYRIIQRGRLVRAIRRGDANAIIRMSRADFGIMSEFIDDEFPARVPFLSLHYSTQEDPISTQQNAVPSDFAIFDGDDVSTIAEGINSSNFLVQKGTAEFLIRFYNFYTGLPRGNIYGDPAATASATRGTASGSANAGKAKQEIRDAMYFYKQDDIVVEEFVLAFEGENPDGRAVIMAGTQLSSDINPGGERVYRTLPQAILRDIRDAVLDETARLPESLRAILGMLTVRATDADADLRYPVRDTGTPVRTEPGFPDGTSEVPPRTSGN